MFKSTATPWTPHEDASSPSLRPQPLLVANLRVQASAARTTATRAAARSRPRGSRASAAQCTATPRSWLTTATACSAWSASRWGRAGGEGRGGAGEGRGTNSRLSAAGLQAGALRRVGPGIGWVGGCGEGEGARAERPSPVARPLRAHQACPHGSVEFRLRLPGADLWSGHVASEGEVALMFMLLGAGGQWAGRQGACGQAGPVGCTRQGRAQGAAGPRGWVPACCSMT